MLPGLYFQLWHLHIHSHQCLSLSLSPSPSPSPLSSLICCTTQKEKKNFRKTNGNAREELPVEDKTGWRNTYVHVSLVSPSPSASLSLSLSLSFLSLFLRPSLPPPPPPSLSLSLSLSLLSLSFLPALFSWIARCKFISTIFFASCCDESKFFLTPHWLSSRNSLFLRVCLSVCVLGVGGGGGILLLPYFMKSCHTIVSSCPPCCVASPDVSLVVLSHHFHLFVFA